MKTADKYISNLDITRTFLNLESNKAIFLCLYSGFLMIISCICALYSALTIRRQLCYCVSKCKNYYYKLINHFIIYSYYING